MGTTYQFSLKNILPFIEPTRESVRKLSLLCEFGLQHCQSLIIRHRLKKYTSNILPLLTDLLHKITQVPTNHSPNFPESMPTMMSHDYK